MFALPDGKLLWRHILLRRGVRIGNHRAQLEDSDLLSAKPNSLLVKEWFTWRINRNGDADNRNGNSKNRTDSQREADVEKTLKREI